MLLKIVFKELFFKTREGSKEKRKEIKEGVKERQRGGEEKKERGAMEE